MREKELRLALICYGGVSLAVYMHGVTREAWHLVRASRDFHEKAPRTDGSQGIYRELMEEIAAETGVKMRVLTDIIAGSSAGGINGIFLAQAIATGQSLEPLTDLWLANADVDRLIDPDARPLSRFTKFWAAPIAWAILRRKGSTIDRTVEKGKKDEITTKLSRFVRARWFQPPFGGTQFSGLLLDALGTMEKSPASDPLLPGGQPLDLFVTVTDFYGHNQQLRLNSPPLVTETEHRLTISFSNRNLDNGYPLAPIPELVFAARATASFPGAFPPFVVGELDRLVRARRIEWPNRDKFLKRILPQHYATGTIDQAVLVDGSILANAPFNQAIDALRNRPARREVDRRFVYIDPKPGLPSFRYKSERAEAETGASKLPGWFATIFGATSNIPREQPIRDSLEKIEGRSLRIARLREVTESLHEEVERTVEALVGKTLFLSRPNPGRLEKWRAMAQEKGAKSAGYSFPAYGHLRLAKAVDDISQTAQRLSEQPSGNDFASRVRETVWQELRKRGLDHMGNAKGLGATKDAIEFFKLHDIRFRIRRLRFLARRLGEQVENKMIGDVLGAEAMQDAIYNALALLYERETADFLGPELAGLAKNACTDSGGFIDGLAKQRNLPAIDRHIDSIFCDALTHLDASAQRTMLLGYLGYPIYDLATLPLLQDEGLDEFDPVKVDRISPDDAVMIRTGGTAATLKGIQFNNFGAFFSRAYRENDYLWGRLHGAERFIDILLSSIPEAARLPGDRTTEFKKRAFHAILDQEAPRLDRSASLIAQIRQEIDSIPAV